MGGVVVTTTVSATSLFADICRQSLKPFFVKLTNDFWSQVNQMVQFFSEDLKMLTGMSRYPKDWITETIMQDWWGERPWFTIEDTITALKDDFIFHGSSPNFFQDLRWYKSIQEDDYGFNSSAIQQYKKLIPFLLDHRNTPQNCLQLDLVKGAELEYCCEMAYTLSHKIRVTGNLEYFKGYLDIINEIIELIRHAMPQTADSLSDYSKVISQLCAGKIELLEANLGKFKGFFGRGQQYVSMVKIK